MAKSCLLWSNIYEKHNWAYINRVEVSALSSANISLVSSFWQPNYLMFGSLYYRATFLSVFQSMVWGRSKKLRREESSDAQARTVKKIPSTRKATEKEPDEPKPPGWSDRVLNPWQVQFVAWALQTQSTLGGVRHECPRPREANKNWKENHYQRSRWRLRLYMVDTNFESNISQITRYTRFNETRSFPWDFDAERRFNNPECVTQTIIERATYARDQF